MDINDLKIIYSNNTTGVNVGSQFKILYDYTDMGPNFLTSIKNEYPTYFSDPASSKYHNSFPKGLVYHSINVAILMFRNLWLIRDSKISQKLNEFSDEEFYKYCKEAVFAGLFHDLVKVGSYLEEEKMSEAQLNYLSSLCFNNGIDFNKYSNLGKKSISEVINLLKSGKINELNNKEFKPQYEYNDDNFNIGHSETSIIRLLRLGAKLSDDQIITIRYHMFSLDPLYLVDHIQRAIMMKFMHKCPMLRSIVISEMESGFIFEDNE